MKKMVVPLKQGVDSGPRFAFPSETSALSTLVLRVGNMAKHRNLPSESKTAPRTFAFDKALEQ